MPGNIRDPYQRATFQGPDPVSTLRDQVSQLSQQVAHLSGMLQQQAARPNPAPPATGNQELLLQLLLAERERADRMHAQLMAESDPVTKIEALSALADMMPQAETNDQPDMLKTALMGLGSVLVENMGSSDPEPSYSPPSADDAPPSPGLAEQPSDGVYVAFDSSGGSGEAPAVDLGLGED